MASRNASGRNCRFAVEKWAQASNGALIGANFDLSVLQQHFASRGAAEVSNSNSATRRSSAPSCDLFTNGLMPPEICFDECLMISDCGE
ncbi:hypothetical protein Plim_1731 [Planctopirus limnophila DSM 3776]|uniref:Uncharacterized protein n=1 Tax=Planctopirus limnophila (strain ATCC 43296 / DSM 3776 / IFAM 1008 / Mu 290) TaxID=521674 RepID=D5SXJ4_PLAL2|nr:hypothetical protein Plim_1731 [Planctopirus limnophila DSM 3776]